MVICWSPFDLPHDMILPQFPGMLRLAIALSVILGTIVLLIVEISVYGGACERFSEGEQYISANI